MGLAHGSRYARLEYCLAAAGDLIGVAEGREEGLVEVL